MNALQISSKKEFFFILMFIHCREEKLEVRQDLRQSRGSAEIRRDPEDPAADQAVLRAHAPLGVRGGRGHARVQIVAAGQQWRVSRE